MSGLTELFQSLDKQKREFAEARDAPAKSGVLAPRTIEEERRETARLGACEMAAFAATRASNIKSTKYPGLICCDPAALQVAEAIIARTAEEKYSTLRFLGGVVALPDDLGEMFSWIEEFDCRSSTELAELPASVRLMTRLLTVRVPLSVSTAEFIASWPRLETGMVGGGYGGMFGAQLTIHDRYAGSEHAGLAFECTRLAVVQAQLVEAVGLARPALHRSASPADSDLESRLTTLETDFETRLAAIESDLGDLQREPRAEPTAAAVPKRPNSAEVAPLGGRLAALEARLSALEAPNAQRALEARLERLAEFEAHEALELRLRRAATLKALRPSDNNDP